MRTTTTAPDRNPVSDRGKSRTPTRRRSNKKGVPTKADVKTPAEATAEATTTAVRTRAAEVAPTRAVKAAQAPAKRGGQATAGRSHRKANIAPNAAETARVGRATSVSRTGPPVPQAAGKAVPTAVTSDERQASTHHSATHCQTLQPAIFCAARNPRCASRRERTQPVLKHRWGPMAAAHSSSSERATTSFCS